MHQAFSEPIIFLEIKALNITANRCLTLENFSRA